MERQTARTLPNIETTVSGIPCGVVLDNISSGHPARGPYYGRHGMTSWGDPEDPPEVEWHLVDRRGYRAAWLEEKLTDDDLARIDAMFLDGDDDDI